MGVEGMGRREEIDTNPNGWDKNAVKVNEKRKE